MKIIRNLFLLGIRAYNISELLKIELLWVKKLMLKDKFKYAFRLLSIFHSYNENVISYEKNDKNLD